MSLWSWEKKEDDQSYKLATENVALQQKINLLENKLAAYESRLEGDYASASYSLDWATMNAFSIERSKCMDGTQNHKTIIGYMMAEPVTTIEDNVTYKDVVREWTLYCSHDEHQRLVAEFNEYKKTK
jgi:hypothetical protein